MFAVCSPGFSYSNMGMGRVLEEEPEPIGHNQNYFYKDTKSLGYLQLPHHQFSLPKQQNEKLNHNARERDRRKKINSLLSSLRSLLPGEDHQTKRVSFPVTIARVLKYIPELQKKVEGLTKKKEELLSRISRQGNAVNYKESHQKKIIPNYNNSAFVVSTSRLNDSEVAIHISSCEVHNTPLSEILLSLENNGLFLLNASSSKTFGGRIFYNLHFQETQRFESDILIQKVLSIYEKKRDRREYLLTRKRSLLLNLRIWLLKSVCIYLFGNGKHGLKVWKEQSHVPFALYGFGGN